MSISGDNPFGYGSQNFREALSGFRAQHGIASPAAAKPSSSPCPPHLLPTFQQRFSAFVNARGGSPAPVPAAQVADFEAGVKSGQWVAYSVPMPFFAAGNTTVYVPSFEKNQPMEFYVRAADMNGSQLYGPIFTLRAT